MMIPSISTGISGGLSRDNSSASQKISQLENQRDKYLEQIKNSADKNGIQAKIDSLERRIKNLEATQKRREEKEKAEDGECETCENRRYQDGSDDPGVSFKSATKISPEAAASAVRGHEMEHVYRNQAKAAREGKKVVSQSVVIKSAICPECGKPYVAGGETRTVTKTKQDNRFAAGLQDPSAAKGVFFDSVA